MPRPPSIPTRSLALGAALTLALAATPAPSRTAEVGVLSVQVIGLRHDRGVLQVALFNSAATWDDNRKRSGGHALRTLSAPIASGTARFSFTGLPYGTYALKAFHDEDRIGRLRTGIFGIPKVDLAFSNNVSIRQGPPSFTRSSFQVNRPYTSLVLRAQRI